MRTLACLRKRSGTILPEAAVYWPTSLGQGRCRRMWLPPIKRMAPEDCFSVLSFRPSCRSSAPGRKNHPWTAPEVTGCSISPCSFTHSDGTSKLAIMNRRPSGPYADTWYAAGRESRWWSTLSISAIVRWNCFHIRKKHFHSTGMSVFRNSGLLSANRYASRYFM